MSVKYTQILITGIVQGVGFRPFVYKIAKDLQSKGWVKNRGGRVEVLIDSQNVDRFIQKLYESPPKHSRIDKIQKYPYTTKVTLKDFQILESQEEHFGLESLIPRDIAICADCLNEINTQSDRHYQYVFTTCSHCGPRYSIINSLPYDRKNTSMADFKMCEDCQNEYDDPNDRRFAAQPNSCPKCAITMKFYISEETYNDSDALDMAIKSIKEGKIIAIKGVGGFALVCDAKNSESIKRLREKKHRPKKPFALMVRDILSAKNLVELNKLEIQALSSPIAPIVLAQKKPSNLLSKFIAPDISTLGIILPYSGLHHLLCKQLDFPIVFTSANLSGEPIIASFDELEDKLKGVYEGVLDYNREIKHSIDDSVMMFSGGEMRLLRLARGLAPLDITFRDFKKNSKKPYLCIGMGAEQKSTLCYSVKNKYLVSPFIGDLNNLASLERYESIWRLFDEIYHLKPKVLSSDLHPNYHSSIISAKKSLEIPCEHIKIQHHQAHFCAIFAEAMLQDKDLTPQTQALGIIWDGTGLGNDGSIWGGEVFLGNLYRVTQIGHFEKFGLIGMQNAIENIDKIAYGLALKCGAYKLVDLCEKKFSKIESSLLKDMFERNINTIETSSVGRLFDAVASFCDILQNNSYEGESGMVLENLSKQSSTQEIYPFELLDGVIRISKMILEMEQDILEGDIAKVAKKFIYTLAQIAFEISSKYENIPVMFSGGVFQNKVLCDRIAELFKDKKFFMHKLMPPNDSNISFGQAVWTQYNIDV